MFDYPGLLDLNGLRNAQVGAESRLAFQDDGNLQIRYEVPYGALSGAVDWLYENRLVLTDFEFAHQPYEGAWRTVKIDGQPARDRQGTITGAIVVQTLAKGYFRDWDWNAVRIKDGLHATGNSVTVDNVTAAASKAFQRWITAELPYIDPERGEAVRSQVTTNAFTDLVVARNVKLDGVWVNMGVAYKEADDKTLTMVVRLAQPNFTLHGYRDHDTPEGEERYYCQAVPSKDAQDILDAWKLMGDGSARKGASGVMESYHNDRNTCNLILAISIEEDEEDSRTVSKKNCAGTIVSVTNSNQAEPGSLPSGDPTPRVTRTVENEKTKLGNYNVTTTTETATPQDLKVPEWKPDIDHKRLDETHKAALPTELANFLAGTFPRSTHGIDFNDTDTEAWRGVRRTITVDINPDCSLDIRGQSTEPDAAGDELDPPIGESYTVLHDLAMYWNQTKAQIEAVLLTLAAQEVGITKQVQITRNDLGRFDMTVNIKTHTDFDATFATTGSGMQVEAKAGINAIESELPTVTAGVRERVSLEISPNDKGQVGWQAKKQTVVETNDYSKGTTGTGIQLEVTAHKNVDPADITTLGASGPRVRVSANLSPNDDGSVDGTIQKQTIVAGTGTAAGSGVGVVDSAKGYANQDTVPAPTAAAKRKRVVPQVQVNDDGTFSGGERITEVEETETSVAVETAGEGAAEGIETRLRLIENADDASHIDFVAGKGKRHSLSVRANDDGTFSGGATEVEVPEVEIPAQTGGAKLRQTVTTGTANARTVEEYDTAPAAGETVTWRGQGNDDGTVTWLKVVETEDDAELTATGGHKEADFTLEIKTEVLRGQSLADISAAPASNGVHISFSGIRINDNELCDYVKTTQTLTLSATSHVILSEDFWQYRDRPLKALTKWTTTWSEADGEWTAEPGAFAKLFGQNQKRNIVRSITRAFSLTRPSGAGASNSRITVGEMQMGPFKVFTKDTETLSIGRWAADGASDGLYIKTLSI